MTGLRSLLQRIMAPAVSEPVSHVHVRYVAATKRENAAQKLRQVSIRTQLDKYVEDTTPEQRIADASSYFAVAASLRSNASVRKGK